MKINIIVSKSDGTSGSEIDANILLFLFKKIRYNIEPKIVPAENYKCDYASINIFVGLINPILIDYAKTNILLFDIGVFPKAHVNTLRRMDYVFTKNALDTDTVRNSYSKDKIVNIGWRSSDLNIGIAETDYRKYLLFCHDKSCDYKKILDTWNRVFGVNKENNKEHNEINYRLHIVNFGLTGLNPKDYTDESIIIEQNITQQGFETLFNTCGIHLCLPKYDGFSHYLNQSMLCRSIPIISNISSLCEIVDDENNHFAFCVSGDQTKNKRTLGKTFNISDSSLAQQLLNTSKLSEEQLEKFGNVARKTALRLQSKNDSIFRETFLKIIKETLGKSKKDNVELKEDDTLPSVSVVTLTHNRTKFFNLAILNFNNIDYPKDKLEWIVYDTSNSDNCVESMLPKKEIRESKYNINYVYDNIIESIGVSRNKAIDLCSNDVIVFMDDDDYYPDTSVKNRVVHLIRDPAIDIVGCRFIGTFEINKYISYIDSPNLYGSFTKHLRVASLAFRRKLLNKFQPFCEDSSINELNQVLSSCSTSIKEISWENTIISLTHTQNTTHRIVPNNDTNGCHFGFGDKLFKFITELDKTEEELKEKEEHLQKALKEQDALKNAK